MRDDVLVVCVFADGAGDTVCRLLSFNAITSAGLGSLSAYSSVQTLYDCCCCCVYWWCVPADDDGVCLDRWLDHNSIGSIQGDVFPTSLVHL